MPRRWRPSSGRCRPRERLARANPSSTRQIEQQVKIHRNIAEIHGRAGRPAEARASYQKSVAIGERGAEAFPSAPDLFGELAYVYPPWIACLVADGETAEALAASGRMRAAVARLLEIHSSSLDQARSADFLRRLGTALRVDRPGRRGGRPVPPIPRHSWRGWRNRPRSTSTTWPAATR